MRRAGIASLLVFVLAVPAPAAQCAWVLWESRNDLALIGTADARESWQFLKAFETKHECDDTAARVVKDRAALWAKVTKTPGRSVSHHPGTLSYLLTDEEKGAVVDVSFECFPSNFDPRPREDR
jgi:hypothetical protein